MTVKEELRQLEESVAYGGMTISQALLEAKTVGFAQASNMAYEMFTEKMSDEEKKSFSIEFIRKMITDD